jgi:hypothetical protein
MLSLKHVLIFCFKDGMTEKVQQINYFKSKYPSLCKQAYMLLSPHKSCVECKESLTYFHNGYKILVNLVIEKI